MKTAAKSCLWQMLQKVGFGYGIPAHLAKRWYSQTLAQSDATCHIEKDLYLAGYLAIEFTLEIWKSQSVKRSKWNQAEDGPKLQVRFVWKPPCTQQGEKCSAIPWWVVEILPNCAAGQVCTGLKTWTKSFLRYTVQCEIAIVIRHKQLII